METKTRKRPGDRTEVKLARVGSLEPEVSESPKPKNKTVLWPWFNTGKKYLKHSPRTCPQQTSPCPPLLKRGMSEMAVMVDLLMKKGEARTFGVIKGDRERVTVGLRQKSCSIAGRNIKQ